MPISEMIKAALERGRAERKKRFLRPFFTLNADPDLEVIATKVAPHQIDLVFNNGVKATAKVTEVSVVEWTATRDGEPVRLILTRVHQQNLYRALSEEPIGTRVKARMEKDFRGLYDLSNWSIVR
jgi:hypothetical protein